MDPEDIPRGFCLFFIFKAGSKDFSLPTYLTSTFPEVGLKLFAAASASLLQQNHTEEENNGQQALKMPRSFLVKKYFTSKKPNYSELESQNGKCETFSSLYMFIHEGLCLLCRVCEVQASVLLVFDESRGQNNAHCHICVHGVNVYPV